MADFDVYREDMVSYYDQASHLAYWFDPDELARQYDGAYACEGSWLRDLALAMQYLVRGRRVLEVAAGHGRWTRFLSESARLVVATDSSDRMLEQARQVVCAGRNLPDWRCKFLRVDAFEIDQVAGEFDYAVSVNFFQHVPIARIGLFLDSLHRKLGSDREVLIAVNRLKWSTRSRFYQKPGEPDWFDLRQLSDGSVYEIVDNPFDESQVRAALDESAEDVRIHRGAKFDWVTYRIA
jgi:SAM-dependent methyltransferase